MKVRTPCHLCGKELARKDSMLRHLRDMHGKTGDVPLDDQKDYCVLWNDQGKKVYGCLLCGEVFTRSSSVGRHKQEVHDKIRFPCPHCSKMFSRKSDVAMHCRIIHRQDESGDG
ncbi:hypothetical protein LSH36_19g07063 [Paralvinella palmiformis]|uniref:C2H2-type domain-containing protein n=1 Tax=Paralvinella palmiformis TaxID=53620 RepID=A0AAD9KBS8_9ANNE|nr:hypothetical protein LSH36_19g07063 [Paralvinella palmiformis]